MKNKPLLYIGISIPVMWAVMAILSHVGFFDFLDNSNLDEFTITLIVALIANIPVLVFIGYGIYSAVTAPSTIPKVKERMPWDKGNPLDVDKEWQEKNRKSKAETEGSNK